MVERTPEGKRDRPWLIVVVTAVIVIAAAAVSMGYLFNPSLSPVGTIRDSDGDGVSDAQDAFPNDPAESRDSDNDGIGDSADFWDMGNGGLLVSIDRFELIAGACDALGLSNCEPSFRLEVDINGDGVTDFSRRADFEDFLDSEPLLNPVDWIFDIPDDTVSVDLIIAVMELDILVDDQIDVHPDSRYVAGWVRVNSPFAYRQFDVQGDQEPIGRLAYSVSAVAV